MIKNHPNKMPKWSLFWILHWMCSTQCYGTGRAHDHLWFQPAFIIYVGVITRPDVHLSLLCEVIAHILSQLNGWDQELIALNFKWPHIPVKQDEWERERHMNRKRHLKEKGVKFIACSSGSSSLWIIILAVKKIFVLSHNSGLLFYMWLYSLACNIHN